MNIYDVFQQLPPIRTSQTEWEANIVFVDTITAFDATDAIEAAKHLPVFKRGRGLAHYPLVSKQTKETQ